VPGGASLKVLVVMEHPGIGSLVPALELLHARGHRVQLAYESAKSVESQREMQALGGQGIAFAELPSVPSTGWTELASWLRCSIDYVRYLEPRYRDARQLRSRAKRKAPEAMHRLGRIAGLAGPRGVATLRWALQLLEQCIAPPAEVERFLADERPDVLLPTHLFPIGTSHADYLRAAKRLGIHTVFPVRGWDNLTNKGLLRDAPELMLVWNEFQAREAEELHGVPSGQILLTGAPSCDHWFEWSPSRDREAFCEEVGLRADRPIVLYVCSSGFVARDREAGFVRRWIDGLRERGGLFGEAGFLIRPHPLNAAQWSDAGLDGDQVCVWPRFGEAPHDDRSKRNFFDSIFHAAAVVGINTTAQIESAIIGRPVHTLLADEFRDTQQGTLHFHYLRAEEYGHLFVGRTFDEHADQLAESLGGRPEDDRNERFLRRFVRPHGLDRSATELVVESIEELGARPAPSRRRGPLASPAVRLLLAPFAAASGRKAGRRDLPGDEERLPIDELRRVVRARAMHRAGVPVVAGPWLSDEIGELLYWIPFLRWAQNAAPGLHERLFLVCRASGATWYEGIGAGQVAVEDLLTPDRLGSLGEGISEDELQGPLRDRLSEIFALGSRGFRVLPGNLVADVRPELAKDPTGGDERLLEFAPLATPPLPDGLGVPDEFLAIRLPESQSGVAAALAERAPVVDLRGLDRAAQAAVVARARGFVGAFGVEACLALLLGRPAVVLSDQGSGSDDERVASVVLGRPPFGRLHRLAAAAPDESAERAAELVETSLEALTAV
jgi:hypothetical protein